jgi:methyl-accepting chemotaxis protein
MTEPSPSSFERPRPRGSAGFAGFRIAGAVFLWSLAGGLGGVLTSIGLERLEVRASGVLRAELQERAEAGRIALAALEGGSQGIDAQKAELVEAKKRAAKNRAVAIALAETIALHPALAAGEASGEIDVAGDRVVASRWSRLEVGATVSTVLPGLLAKIRKEPSGLVVEDAAGILAFGPLSAENRIHFARVEPPPPTGSVDVDLPRAVNALVGMAAPIEPFAAGDPKSVLVFLFAGALAGALVGFVWARIRVGRPIEKTLDAARAFVHGAPESRADEKTGGRDARDLARAVNALIESAERLKLQGRAAREEDVRAMALAIHALGRGDLASAIPEVSDALAPVRDAIEAMRRETLARIGEIQKMSIEVAENAADVGPNAKKVWRAALEQVEALRVLAKDAHQATEEVRAATERLGAAVKSLARFADGERRGAREVQNALNGASHRAQELKRGAARVEALVATAEAIDEALDVLAQAGNQDNPPAKARITSAVGQGRAAMEGLTRELVELRDEFGVAAESLEAIARSVPESGAELEPIVTQNLHEAAARLLRIIERTSAGIKGLERSAKIVSEGAGQIADGAAANVELAPRIGALAAEFSLGQSFEAGLMERLERWKNEAEAAKSAPDGLTEDGRQMVKQVVEASEQARQRLQRLVSVTENAIDVLRG